MKKTAIYLLFVGEYCGKGKEAMQFYTSLVEDSEIKSVEYYKSGDPEGNEGDLKVGQFSIGGQDYMIEDSPLNHKFTFTPAVSIYINCENKDEIHSLYKQLSDGGEIMVPIDKDSNEKFVWLADKYGVSWQLKLSK